MNNSEFLKLLEDIKWLETVPKDNHILQDEIKNAKENPDDTRSFSLVEGCFDSENMYELYSILEDMIQATQGDLCFSDIRNNISEEYHDPDSLFNDINNILKNKGINKAFYIIPYGDQMVFYVYKPKDVYGKAVNLGLI